MKHIVFLLTLLMMIFGFSTGAFSAGGICTNCSSGETLRAIPCVPGSGGCAAFDYNLNALNHDGGELEDGYCGNPSTGNYRAIVDISVCPYPEDKFVVGKVIGIRMTILVNGEAGEHGAYWSGPVITSPGIAFDAFVSASGACGADTAQGRFFGVPTYYLSDMTPVTSLTEDPACVVPDENRSTILEASGYTIDQDMINNWLNRWWVDIPPVRVDPSVIAVDDVISVQIEILYEYEGTMMEWTACDGEIDIAVVGCENQAMPWVPLLLLGD